MSVAHGKGARMMTDAERKRLQEELAGGQRHLAEFQAQLQDTPEGGAQYQKARDYWKGRIEQAQDQISRIETSLRAD
jgi:chromosome segregation ATPase